MGGSLMQLVACGSQDAYLTGNPQITFFKIVYRRHTNFASESIEQYFNSSANFDKTGVATVSRNGDLITQALLKVVLPAVKYSGDFTNFGHVQFAWVKNIGQALIDEVKLEIGGSEIDRHFSDWLHIWQELSQNSGHAKGLDKMLGNVPELTELSTLSWDAPDKTLLKPAKTLYIPLMFYFCRNNGLALPLIALQYHEVRISVKIKPANRLFVASQAYKSGPGNLSLDEVSLFINYISLDTEERRRFAQVAHEYLIEQLQHSIGEKINSNSGKYKLNFNHPVKAIYFVTKLGNYQGGKFMVYDHDDWKNALKNAAKLLLLSQYDLDEFGYFDEVSTDLGDGTYVGSNGLQYFSVDPANPCEEPRYVFNDSATLDRFDGSNFIGRLANHLPLLARKTGDDLKNKVDGIIRIYTDTDNDGLIYPEVEKITRNDLTIADLSIPVSKFDKDNRSDYVKGFDLFVWQHHNYGLYIDGSVNPVSSVELKLNGHARQSKRAGVWHDTVEHYMHHTNTPKDGLNAIIFSLKVEDHQPSGTCNMSRIDTAEVILEFIFSLDKDMQDVFIDPDNSVSFYGVNYNVLRLMSGMGGLAYSN